MNFLGNAQPRKGTILKRPTQRPIRTVPLEMVAETQCLATLDFRVHFLEPLFILKTDLSMPQNLRQADMNPQILCVVLTRRYFVIKNVGLRSLVSFARNLRTERLDYFVRNCAQGDLCFPVQFLHVGRSKATSTAGQARMRGS